MFSQKERDQNNLKEKNERLRHILSEYNYFSVDKLDLMIHDPEWKQEEYPIVITKVENNEVSFYINYVCFNCLSVEKFFILLRPK